MPRIISGAARGRTITVPPVGTRPTADRVREAAFNALAARLDFDGLTVLDLYAGSGALGLEALSRGAASADFVESNPKAAKVIAANIATLGFANAHVRRTDALAYLRTPPDADLIFADPPYDLPEADIVALLHGLASGAPGSLAVLEFSRRRELPPPPPGLSVVTSKNYGDTRVDILEVGSTDA